MTKISVIIPVYNAEEFLTESVDSILNQSFTDTELICVNDGSTDHSLTILNNMAKKDSRIIVIDKINGGCGSARNMGLKHATGEYVYFFDPDDYILPDAFEKLYNNAINNDSDIVLSQIAWYSEGKTINYNKPGYNIQDVFSGVDFNNFSFDYHDIKDYVLNSYYAPWTKLYKKTFLDKYDFKFEENIAFDDVPFHVQSMLKAEKISFVEKAFYHYRTSNSNSVNNTVSNAVDIMRICDIVEDYLRQNDYYPEFIREFNIFKVTQILLYIIFSYSECYYKYAKHEFIKMNLKKEDLPKNLYEEYVLVLFSKNYEEYRIKKNATELPDRNKEFTEKIRKNDQEKIALIEKNNDTVNKYQFLTKEHENLIDMNEKLKNELEDVKKINETMSMSKAWRLNMFITKILNKFRS